MSPIPSDSALFAPLSTSPAPIRPLTMMEPLCFDKVPLSPPCRSASMSTDCESVLSDGADLSRSPSLLTSLIQSQTRRSTRTTPATTPGVSPTVTPAPLPLTSRPILRRCSTGAFSDAVIEEGNSVGLPRRRSCLKFAVDPRPLQFNRSSVSTASSRRASCTSSRLTSPRCATPALEEDDEEDEEATTAFDTDDAGYQEDSEDGFTSDEDGPPLVPLSQWPATWSKQAATPRTMVPAPILWTAARRAADLAEPSTDDCASSRPRRVRVEDTRDTSRRGRGRCSTHRSPPPASRIPVSDDSDAPSHAHEHANGLDQINAPPAAHSPSAASLCRRRAPNGWRSDEGARARAGAITFLPRRKASHVKFDISQGRCSMVVRRDSEPAAGVEEVHVLADSSVLLCPIANLRALTS